MLEVVANSGSQGIVRPRNSVRSSTSSTANVVVSIQDKNDNAPYMVLTVTPPSREVSHNKHVLLAELTVPADGLQAEGTCVDFPYAFYDDDAGENGNVTYYWMITFILTLTRTVVKSVSSL